MTNVTAAVAPPVKHKRPTIWQLALPSIAANLMFSTVAMIQTRFVGGLGAPAVAAVGAGQRVFFALQALLMAIGVGTTAMVARSWGAGEQEEASRITSSSLMFGGRGRCHHALRHGVFPSDR